MSNSDAEITAYTYLYNCSRWWGKVSGVRNIAHEGVEKEVVETAINEAKRVSGSATCNVALLQKFKIAITLAEPYTALMQFPLSSEKPSKRGSDF